MATTDFVPSVQYGDWLGRVEADDVYPNDISEWAREAGLIANGEGVLAIRLSISDTQTGDVAQPCITILYANYSLFESLREGGSRENLKAKEAPISVQHLLEAFKRFSFVMTRSGFSLGSGFTIELEE